MWALFIFLERDDILIGRLIECQRCHRKKFLKYIGEQVFDGGFTRETYFETSNWLLVPGRSGIGDEIICPDCFNSFKRLMEDFYDSAPNNEDVFEAPKMLESEE